MIHRLWLLMLLLVQGCDLSPGVLGVYEPASPEIASQFVEVLIASGAEELARSGPNPPESHYNEIVNLRLAERGIVLSISLVPGNRLTIQVASEGGRSSESFQSENFLWEMKAIVESISGDSVRLTIHH